MIWVIWILYWKSTFYYKNLHSNYILENKICANTQNISFDNVK